MTDDPRSEKAARTPGPFERHRRKALALVAIAPLVLLDCAASLVLGTEDFHDFRSPHAYYHHGFLPNQEATSRWGSGAPYPVFTNSLGMLDKRVRDVEPVSTKTRIVVIGDSFTEGLGVPYPQTFVGLLAERADPARVEILNAAALSYSPRLYHLRIRHLLREQRVRFDHLAVFIDISDIQDEVLYRDFEPGSPHWIDELQQNVHRSLKRISFFYGSASSLWRRAAMKMRMADYDTEFYPPWLNYFWLDNVNTEAYDDPDFLHIRESWTLSKELADNPWTRKGIASAVEQMDQLVRLTRANGVGMTIAVYPWSAQVEHRNIDGMQSRLWRRFARERQIGFIDLFPVMIGDLPHEEFERRYTLEGDIHWNAAGHALVADAVWPHLESTLR